MSNEDTQITDVETERQQLCELADIIIDGRTAMMANDSAIPYLRSKTNKVRSILMALHEFEFKKDVTESAIVEAIEQIDEVMFMINLFNGSRDLYGPQSPIRYDRDGNRFFWDGDKCVWVQSGTLC
jgi:hypothetical protein